MNPELPFTDPASIKPDQTLTTASQDMLRLVKAHQAQLHDSCYEELARCTRESGIPEELKTRSRRTLDELREASSNLDTAQKQTAAMADELHARLHDTDKAVNRRWYRLNPPANGNIDLQEEEKAHFTGHMNLYKLALVFIIGSFAGVMIELLWCLLRHGYIESRNGVVWGPFSPLYGLGAAALSLALYRYRNRGPWLSFLGGFVIGSVVEYACSWFQETAFGSRSWDYSNMPFNINGRICLLYSLFWGILGVFWIKDIYPRMSKWILKLPDRPGRLLTWALTIFMVVNCLVSGLAVLRWSERLQGHAADNAYEVFMDAHFPDERMSGIYANMDFGSSIQPTEGESE